MIKKRQRRSVLNNYIVLVILFSGCSDQSVRKETLDLGKSSIELNSAVFIKNPDSLSEGKVLWNGIDTIYFQYGLHVNNLSENDKKLIFLPFGNNDSLIKTLDSNVVDVKQIAFTNKPDPDIDEFRKQNVFFETISGFRAKIIQPRMPGNGGITGVFFDSVGKTSVSRLKFHLYSPQLDSLKTNELLKAIRTIKFNS